MEMARETKDKLKRYLLNADPFLWNVLDKKNKKERLRELQTLGFLAGYSKGSNPIYSKINQDLLVELGIEGIIERIIFPKVTALFKPDILQYFRRCWEQGQAPILEYLKKNRLYRKHIFSANEVYDGSPLLSQVAGYKEPAFVFVQIDTQHDFVERWTVFAGLWFEEIEPLLGPVGGGITGSSR
ncbi:MAG: hypothetical protein Q7T57_05130 [Dehalococcoidales bacterium]|nr:hypothetical protein [Dehalococcoidales bacterium]